jgi:hypothetical protein
VLADPERFNGVYWLIPIEGVSYGRTTAMVMLREATDTLDQIIRARGMSYTGA